MRAEIGDDLLSLLPRGAGSLDVAAIAELADWFGPKGRFPAQLISGE